MGQEAGTASYSRAGARFPCFDGLRAIAALSVFTFHFLGIESPTWVRGNLRAFVLRLGQQGVAIFFVISGFLLYRPFVDAALRGIRSPALGPFWLRRFVRIFPAYWIALTAYVYIFGLFTIHGPANFLTYYGLLENYRGGYALLGLGIAWTLAIEVSFYLVLPLISQVARAIAGGHATVERLFRVQIAVVTVLAVTGVAVRALNISIVKSSPRGAWFPLHASAYSLFAYFDWFAVGMAFAVLSASSAHGRPLAPTVTLLSRYPTASWIAAFAVFVFQMRLLLAPPSNVISFVLPCLLPVTAGFLVFPAVFGAPDQGFIRRALRTRVLQWLGLISYGIYLWHFTFVSLSFRWIADGRIPNDLFVRFLAVAACTLAAASASFYIVEKPLITWSQRISRQRSTGPFRSVDAIGGGT